ncbi:uncharacterized protein [Henckelia pumila]|uniref:uncharacterized protein isoform X2 n=1 Tax=Henckelia pumila TaxID=405737 RepID=UPI003C6DDB34
MDRNGSLLTWDQFMQGVRCHFGASVYDDPLGKIAKLFQTGSVNQYRTEFGCLMNRIEGVDETLFLNIFIWGLKPEIRRELLIHPPTSLIEAMNKAQLFEDRNNDLKGVLRAGGMNPNSTVLLPPPINKAPGEKMGLGMTEGRSHPNTTPKLPIKRLTIAEMKERREKGLCFNCDEKFNANHLCKNRVMVLLGDDWDDYTLGVDVYGEKTLLELDEGVTEVSLHTLTSSATPRIFRITANFQQIPVKVLIDTGSHNNFLQEGLIERLGMVVTESRRLRVYMGNGQYLWCDKV